MDGIPMIDRGSTKQSLSQLDVNRIERVEIVEGPMSVVYGTDALAGVINIITKKGPGYSGESTWRVGARIQEETMGKEYQFFNGEGLHNESIDLGFNLKNGLYFNGGYTRNDNGGWQGDLTGREKALASQRPVAGQRYDRVPATQPERLVPAGFPRREKSSVL